MRVLFLAHRVPYAPDRGDRIRSFQMLRHLRRCGIPVHLVALAHDRHEAEQGSLLADLVTSFDIVPVTRTRNLCRAVPALLGSTPLTHVLLDGSGMRDVLVRCRSTFGPDRVLSYGTGMARFAMQPPLDDLPLVLDMIDVDSAKWDELGAKGGWRARIYRREARVLRAFEIEASRAARATLIISEAEAEVLRGLDTSLAPVVLPQGVDATFFSNPGPASPAANVVFTGVFSYEPNWRAALWLVEEIWPLVVAARPGARLTLAGADPVPQLRKAAARHGVEVTGRVPDVRPYLWRSAVAVAPLVTARGVQNKVLEAIAAGLPAVVTPQVFKGLPAQVHPACRVADDAGTFADAMIDWLAASPEERQRIAGAADLDALSWPARLQALPSLLAS